ncbi:hypothetical protein [Peribacillus simplex]|uniref:hypothetical protein n=1 Tax=Peribacillus simplex TaxID=1478 RepID=UPI001141085A|nr:hypothetical protein [Peribacillus simplex]
MEINVQIVQANKKSYFQSVVYGLASADLSEVFSCGNGRESNDRIFEKGLNYVCIMGLTDHSNNFVVNGR